MTLLSICQAVANYIPVTAPLQIIGNNDQTAQLLLQCAQAEGEALARRPQGGWVAMIKEYDFTTVAIGPLTGTLANSGAGGVAVITGLSSTTGLAAGTFYVMGEGLLDNTIIASVDSSSQVTLNQAASTTGSGISFTFGQSGYALPSDFERPIDNTMWDRSRFWSMRGPLSPQQWQLYKSSVIGQASIQRRFRFRRISGANRFSIDPVPTDNGSALVYEYVSNAWCQSAASPPVPQTTWQADTDTGILDEWLIQLGVRWRALRRLGMSYAEELDEYERQVDKAVAHDGGAAILDLTPSSSLSLIGPWNLPETNFGGVTGT